MVETVIPRVLKQRSFSFETVWREGMVVEGGKISYQSFVFDKVKNVLKSKQILEADSPKMRKAGKLHAEKIDRGKRISTSYKQKTTKKEKHIKKPLPILQYL